MEHSIYAELCNILALLAQEQTISVEVYILSLVLAPPYTLLTTMLHPLPPSPSLCSTVPFNNQAMP